MLQLARLPVQGKGLTKLCLFKICYKSFARKFHFNGHEIAQLGTLEKRLQPVINVIKLSIQTGKSESLKMIHSNENYAVNISI